MDRGMTVFGVGMAVLVIAYASFLSYSWSNPWVAQEAAELMSILD